MPDVLLCRAAVFGLFCFHLLSGSAEALVIVNATPEPTAPAALSSLIQDIAAAMVANDVSAATQAIASSASLREGKQCGSLENERPLCVLTSGRDLRKRERPGGDNSLQHQQRRGDIRSKQSVRDNTVPPRLTVPPFQLLRCSFQSRCLGPSALRLLDTLLLCRARLCRRLLAVLSDADSTTAVSIWWLYHCCR